MIAIQPKSRQILGVNQQAYQALKAAMSLNLRRQLLVAVCDNVVLQNQLATQLENDLAQVNWSLPRGASTGASEGSLVLERLVFDPEDAHLPRQVAHWVRQTMLIEGSLPQVQVLGIEQMTRQPALIQNHFLRSLEQVEALLPRLNTSLLVWVPWPWLRTIQSSSPTFWKWRNGVFEFVSDPTPTLSASEAQSERPASGDDQPLLERHRDRTPEAINYASAVDHVSTPAHSNDRSHDVLASDPLASSGDYARIELPPVVALYGETDDSDISDYGQPTLETIATWEASDAVSTTLRTASAPQENQENNVLEISAAEGSDPENSDPENGASVYQAIDEFFTSEKTSLLAAATAALNVHESTESEKPAQISTAAKSAAAINAVNREVASPSVVAKQEAAELVTTPSQPVQGQPVQGQLVQSQPVQSQPVQSQPVQESQAQQSVIEAPQTKQTTISPSKFPIPSAFGQQANRNSAEIAAQEVIQKAQRQKAADGYFEVGHSYRRRIEAGERGLDLIEPAIAAYEGALRCLSGPHPSWGSGLNDLGTLYWLKAQQLDDQQQVIDCMSQSVQLYSQALTKIELNQSTDIACQLYSNLGAVLSMLATRKDPVGNFKKAADAYLKALPFCPLDIDPQEFATLQNSLGSVYWKLSHYEQDKPQVPLYLQQAITAYEQAGLAYNPYERPLEYAAVQNNLGITYWSLAKHQDAVPAFKNAIAAYRDALNYRTPESDAAACAITYNNLALAYWDLSKSDDVLPEPRRRYQRNAITAFEAALKTADRVGTLSKTDSAAIHHCLGDVHAQMVEGAPTSAEMAEGLHNSLDSYVQAIADVSMESPTFEARLAAIVANLRSHKEHLGLSSQQTALNHVPAHLFSLVMQSL